MNSTTFEPNFFQMQGVSLLTVGFLAIGAAIASILFQPYDRIYKWVILGINFSNYSSILRNFVIIILEINFRRWRRNIFTVESSSS